MVEQNVEPARKCDVCSSLPAKSCSPVGTHLLLLRRVSEIGVEEAQEDVQGADKSAGD